MGDSVTLFFFIGLFAGSATMWMVMRALFAYYLDASLQINAVLAEESEKVREAATATAKLNIAMVRLMADFDDSQFTEDHRLSDTDLIEIVYNRLQGVPLPGKNEMVYDKWDPESGEHWFPLNNVGLD